MEVDGLFLLLNRFSPYIAEAIVAICSYVIPSLVIRSLVVILISALLLYAGYKIICVFWKNEGYKVPTFLAASFCVLLCFELLGYVDFSEHIAKIELVGEYDFSELNSDNFGYGSVSKNLCIQPVYAGNAKNKMRRTYMDPEYYESIGVDISDWNTEKNTYFVSECYQVETVTYSNWNRRYLEQWNMSRDFWFYPHYEYYSKVDMSSDPPEEKVYVYCICHRNMNPESDRIR